MMNEISKKEKLGPEQNHPDLLTNLPLGIILNILARIPIRGAVQTCILSSQWRYTWVTLPQLVFKGDYCPRHTPQDKRKECMQKFITNALLHHQGPIYKFQVSVQISPCSQTIDQWMLCLSSNDIRELIIDMGCDESCYSELHSNIYSFEKLTYLELFNCELDMPPSTFKGFLFLKGLDLCTVGFSNQSRDGIESLLANSPLLENLSITRSFSSDLHIDSPNLKHLFLRGEYTYISLQTPLLAKMKIELHDNNFTFDYKQEEDLKCNYTDFLGGLINLEKLSVDEYTMKYLSVGIESWHSTLMFTHLKVIKIGGVNYKHISESLVVARLIVGAPNLEKLILRSDDFTERDYYPNLEARQVSFMDLRSALNSRFEKLRSFEMSGISGYVIEMEFIKYLLENSPVLQAVWFEICYDLATKEKQILRDVLLSCTCASPIAKISAF